MNKDIKEMIKNALILFGITLIAGLLVGAVYEITEGPREEQKEEEKKAAYEKVLSEADSFAVIDIDSAKIIENLKKYDITEKNVVVDECVKGLDESKKAVGYIVSVTSKEGYGGNISISVGFDMKGNLTGVSILSISETAGLGENAKKPEFLDQYKVEEADLKDGMLLYIVNKADNADGYNIDALSGATITSNAMTKAVNAAKITANYLMDELSINESDTATQDESTAQEEGGEADE